MLNEITHEISQQLGLSEDEVFAEGLTFKDVLSKSPTAVNSIDIVEAIAVALSKYGLEDTIQIPALTLDDETMSLKAHFASVLPVEA